MRKGLTVLFSLCAAVVVGTTAIPQVASAASRCEGERELKNEANKKKREIARGFLFRAAQKKYKKYQTNCTKIRDQQCPSRKAKLDARLANYRTKMQSISFFSGLFDDLFKSDLLTGLTCPRQARFLCSKVVSLRKQKDNLKKYCERAIAEYCGTGFDTVQAEYRAAGGDAYDAAVLEYDAAVRVYAACLSGTQNS